MLTRRHFIAATAAGVAGAPYSISLAGPSRRTPLPRDQARYGFVLLGDLHYDKLEHHDMDWVRREKPNDVRQINGYVAATRDHMPRLFANIMERISKAKAPLAAVVHIGDFVEGLCGSYELQSLQNRDAITFVEQADLGKPFLMAKGNHDITGPDAGRAFDDVLLPWMSKQAASDLQNANYTWEYAGDLFIFFDAYRPDLSWLDSVSDKASRAGRVFFVIHPPVVPYNARSSWNVFNRDHQAHERKQLLAWLGRHEAVVLCGHLHRYSHLRRSTVAGAFTQLALNSVVRSDSSSLRNQRSGTEAYGAELLNLEPDFSKSTRKARAAWLEREKPFIQAFDYARFPGYAMLWVYDDAVEADLYLGTSDEVLKTRRL